MAKEQKRLIIKNQAAFLGMESDVVTVAIPVDGIIAAKDGKATHVVAGGKWDIPRSDGRIVTVQVNAWYK